jgi:uncharacterized phiE125 gp8 family phage protein
MMRTALICLSEPDAFVDLSIAKRQLKIADTDSSQDTILQSYLDAACSFLDGADGSLKRAVGEQTWKLVLPAFNRRHQPGDRFQRDFRQDHRHIELPLPPIRSVTSIKYFDSTGTEQTLDPAAYRLVNCGSERSRVVPVTCWPSPQCREDAVSVTFDAGYGDDAGQVAMPKVIRQAVLLMVKRLYDLGARNVFLASSTVEGVGAQSYFTEGAISAVQGVIDDLLFNVRLTG